LSFAGSERAIEQIVTESGIEAFTVFDPGVSQCIPQSLSLPEYPLCPLNSHLAN
jgi:hypothetical protein